MSANRKIAIGTTVRDNLSGLEGVVVARTEWMYGCVRITVQPLGSHEGKPFDSITIDEPQCVVVTAAPEPESREPRHGPHPEPIRRG